MARNGCKKVIIVNGDGGNENLLPFFAQTQLERRHDYVVYVLGLVEPPTGGPPRRITGPERHAGEVETSTTMVSHPEVVHLDRARSESGADLGRQKLPDNLYTGIWWYARFPNHYSGDGSVANPEMGQYKMSGWIDGIVKSIRAVKAGESLKLQNEFFEKAAHPLEMRP